jgi:hypothetical protein
MCVHHVDGVTPEPSAQVFDCGKVAHGIRFADEIRYNDAINSGRQFLPMICGSHQEVDVISRVELFLEGERDVLGSPSLNVARRNMGYAQLV